jgi:hypothetical protein
MIKSKYVQLHGGVADGVGVGLVSGEQFSIDVT